MDTLSLREARRLALARAGLLAPRWGGLPRRAQGSGKRARKAAHAVVERFGYLQLDTVSIAGARSHSIVLLSRLEGLDPALGEELLRPGEPLFEYWGHEASWLPLALYPALEFRRAAYRERSPWWGDLLAAHRKEAAALLARVRDEGPLRTVDMEGSSGSGWWELKLSKKIAHGLWSSGALAIRERRGFQRTYDLAERVIPDDVRARPLPQEEGLAVLLLKALDGHGWATTGTLAQTWRLRNMRAEIAAVLERLVAEGRVLPCALEAAEGGRPTPGWIRPADRELAARLVRLRPRADEGVLLSPFDPLLWDRPRVQRLFGFDALLEVFKPAEQRRYGYYCLPVLAGDRLVARLDLKADRKRGRLHVLSVHYEGGPSPRRPRTPVDREATHNALARYAAAIRCRTPRTLSRQGGAG